MKKQTLNILRNQKGMSLIEIMIVLAIVGTVVAGIMNVVGVQGDRADRQNARTQIAAMEKYAKMYKRDNKKWPTSVDDLVGEFYEEEPTDPWGNSYEISPGEGKKGVVICSMGPDENDETDDICNTDPDDAADGGDSEE